MKPTIASRLAGLVKQYGLRPSLSCDSDPQQDLFSNGFLDSFSAISLIAIIEDEYNINFTYEQLASDDMRTLSGITKIIEMLLSRNV